MPPPRKTPLPWLKPAIVVGSLAPIALLAVRFFRGTLGANPIATSLNQLGLLALLLLLACLSCTPLRLLTSWTWPVRIRRTFGLLAFGTACLHFLVYVVADQGLDLGSLLKDIAKRPFIFVGLLALSLLVPLALTSSRKAVRRLGHARWQRLHRLVYVIGALAVVHFAMRVKADLTEPMAYGSVLFVLLAVRAVSATSRRISARKERAASS